MAHFATAPWNVNTLKSNQASLAERLTTEVQRMQSTGFLNHLLVVDTAESFAAALHLFWNACSSVAFEWSVNSLVEASHAFIARLYCDTTPAYDDPVWVRAHGDACEALLVAALKWETERSPQFVPAELLADKALQEWVGLLGDRLIIGGAGVLTDPNAQLRVFFRDLAGVAVQVACKGLVSASPKDNTLRLMGAPQASALEFNSKYNKYCLFTPGQVPGAGAEALDVSPCMYPIAKDAVSDPALRLLRVRLHPAAANASAAGAAGAGAAAHAAPTRPDLPEILPPPSQCEKLSELAVLVPYGYMPDPRPAIWSALAAADPRCAAAEAAANAARPGILEAARVAIAKTAARAVADAAAAAARAAAAAHVAAETEKAAAAASASAAAAAAASLPTLGPNQSAGENGRAGASVWCET